MVTSRPRSRSVVLGLVALALMATVAAMPATAAPQRPDPVGSDPFRRRPALPRRLPRPDGVARRRPLLRRLDHGRGAEPADHHLHRPRTWTAAPTSDPREATPYDAMPTPGAVGPDRARPAPAALGRDLGTVGRARWRRARTTSTGWRRTPSRTPPASAASRCACSRSPMGRSVDTSPRPMTCGTLRRDRPADLRRPRQLLAAAEGRGAPRPDLGAPAQRLRQRVHPGSRFYPLVAPTLPWEGIVVENPAMIRFHKRLYLFYSANGFALVEVHDRLRDLQYGHRSRARRSAGC